MTAQTCEVKLHDKLSIPQNVSMFSVIMTSCSLPYSDRYQLGTDLSTHRVTVKAPVLRTAWGEKKSVCQLHRDRSPVLTYPGLLPVPPPQHEELFKERVGSHRRRVWSRFISMRAFAWLHLGFSVCFCN